MLQKKSLEIIFDNLVTPKEPIFESLGLTGTNFRIQKQKIYLGCLTLTHILLLFNLFLVIICHI
jgi:hypothetical protein